MSIAIALFFVVARFSKVTEGNYTLHHQMKKTETHVPIQSLISFIGSPTLGEHFNPAKDCSDIEDNLPEATDGFYWIKPTKGKLFKVKMIKSSQKRYSRQTTNNT